MEPISGIVAPESGSGPGKGMMVSILIWKKRPVAG
jgi:hypothetical protein